LAELNNLMMLCRTDVLLIKTFTRVKRMVTLQGNLPIKIFCHKLHTFW